LASVPHDFDGWQPLKRLAYTRLPGQQSPTADTRTDDDNDEASWLGSIWEEEIQRRIKYDNFGLRVTRDNDYGEEARSNAEAQVCTQWREPLSNGALPAPPLGYLLHSAVMHHQPRRVKWLLEHGANADASIDVDGDRKSGSEIRCITLVEAAEAKGYDDIAELLSWYGDPRLRIVRGET